MSKSAYMLLIVLFRLNSVANWSLSKYGYYSFPHDQYVYIEAGEPICVYRICYWCIAIMQRFNGMNTFECINQWIIVLSGQVSPM